MKKLVSLALVLGPLLFLTPAKMLPAAEENGLKTAFTASFAAEAKGDYQAALKPLAALGNNAASIYVVQLRLGWLNYCTKDWQQSISFYGKAAALAPFAIEPLLGKMMAQQTAGKNDDALNTAQVALRLDPNNYTATSRTAWLLYLKRDYRQAALTYRKLVSLYPTDTEMLLGLGFALKANGEKKEAAGHFLTVLLLSPNNPRALEGLNHE